jgi:hypothetical protein
MIVREFYRTREDGVNLYRTYSDRGLKIRKIGTNEIYDDAVDIESALYIYDETDTPVDTMTEDDSTLDD